MVFIEIKKLWKEQIWENVLGEITHSILDNGKFELYYISHSKEPFKESAGY